MHKELSNYPFKDVEKKRTSKEWKSFPYKNGTKKYIIPMLFYPSGKLHIGHILVYTISDIITRYQHYLGHKVYSIMGCDAFGLPAENAAIENGTHPSVWTYKNRDEMYNALQQFGILYDWNNQVTTCDKEYYSKQQRLFIEFFKKGWIVRKKSIVNWDPVEQTVLANEQVSADGTAWRSKAKVELKPLEQWFIKISDFAEELLEDLKLLEGHWPDRIITMQRNWIGKSTGMNIKFKIDNKEDYIEIFTTMPETVYGVTFLAISKDYAIEKFGSAENEFVGYAINHFNNKKIPVFIADYVISDYGTGAVMGVPAEDIRDKNFVLNNGTQANSEQKKHEMFKNIMSKTDIEVIEILEDGKMINSDFLNGLPQLEAREAMFKKYGSTICYRLRDWCVSRQRYWGCPIPMNYCEKCGYQPAKDLPVVLPEDVIFGKGNPLATNLEWQKTNCSVCNGVAKRETDTLDTFVDSAWYFIEYLNKKKKVVNEFDIEKEVLPIDYYLGGPEHATGHMIYARFWTKRMRDLGYVDIKEPFTNFICNGMVCSPTYIGVDSKKYYFKKELIQKGEKFFAENGEEVVLGAVEKMSKSLKNGIDPLEVASEYGIDAVRMFIVSDSPIDQDVRWNDDALKGCWKFLNRVWKLAERISHVTINQNYKNTKLNNLCYGISEDIKRYYFNTAIAQIRTLINGMEDLPLEDSGNYFRTFLIYFSSICPTICAEIYEKLFNKNILEESWVNINYIDLDEVEIAISLNGKTKHIIKCSVNITESEILAKALELCKITDYKKYIFIKNKILNLVV